MATINQGCRGWLCVLCVLMIAGCGDADVAKSSVSDGGGAAHDDGHAALQDGATTDSATTDGATTDGATTADADAGLPDGASGDDGQTEDGGAQTDAAQADAAQVDATQTDAAQTDAAQADAAGADAGGATNPCPTCLVGKQPGAGQPGGKGSCGVQAPKEIAYGSGFGEGYKKMLVYRPSCAGGHPVLFFVHDKGVYNAGGFIGKFGEGYRKLMEHVASHGTIAVFVRVESGLLDGNHDRMADDLLAATQVLFKKVSVALPSEVVFAGHGMGAKVAILATVKTYGNDSKKAWVDPRAVLAFAVDNQKSLITSSYTDASLVVPQIPAKADVSFTFVQSADDTKTPYNDPNKPNALAIYAGLKIARKQVIVLHGTGSGDPNPPTSPELHDDHGAAMTIVGKPGGAADFINKTSYLDALDWYGFWKITVGAIDFHFNKGDKKWAYGAMRTHGGTLPSGKIVTHEVLKEQGL